jgi:hypothetical protein
MAKKGLDTTFLHYGIRRDDMGIIEALCTEHQLEFDWVKEKLLRGFHETKIRNQAISGLQLGELIIKNPTAITLGVGKRFKKIKVRYLI